ncbi:GNAT family N-acetyltransferase [Terrimonas sp. NA20]|uniref:GNAT family N-acetyltransferase n=1 Tax=Terrimonas ginsenosidimutans TaxID=2908004 RepID=A0ABS9KLL1_9BACT|nr:GNAT family N-acetyltransferase [Terrimonas ginsenosidimutans]MCG2613202.1 GNAT family N-acetyltransferase [Terrimonas ginsenosidimutans]
MKSEEIRILKATKPDRLSLIEIWESAVRATHHFLSNDDILYFRQQILDQYFDMVDLYLLKISNDETAGFLGLSPGKIEMLFIDPAYFRKGLGSILLSYAVTQHAVTKVDVNEDNPDALQFYLRKGFHIINRLEKDADGKDFPILQMKLV